MSYVIEKDQGIVGFIIGQLMNWHDDGYFEIIELCVKRDSKRQGYGSVLLRHLEGALLNKGVTSMILITQHGNEAWDFYLDKGFNKMDDMVLMNKFLDTPSS